MPKKPARRVSAARDIRRGIEQPGLIAYFVVAAASALLVLAAAGYLARPDQILAGSSSASQTSELLPALAGSGARAERLVEAVDLRPQAAAALMTKDSVRPDQITVNAGVPATLVFSGDASCASTISFTDFEVRSVITRDGMVEVELPALEPGVYPFSCANGSVSGVVLAE